MVFLYGSGDGQKTLGLEPNVFQRIAVSLISCQWFRGYLPPSLIVLVSEQDFLVVAWLFLVSEQDTSDASLDLRKSCNLYANAGNLAWAVVFAQPLVLLM